MIYLTYAEPYSGVISSQVIDVCRFIKRDLKTRVRLVMFISVRNYFAERRRIKKEMPSAWVIPMSPRISSWRFNRWALGFICLITGERALIARNALAANIAFSVKKLGLLRKICYDGRGAVTAEWNEYRVVPSVEISRSIVQLEADAVNKADFRIAVSSHLVTYWQNTFEYHSSNHVVIPCTLHSSFVTRLITTAELDKIRKKLGYNPDDCLMVYSGSLSGWQSFHMLSQFLETQLSATPKNKVLFLSEKNDNVKKLMDQYPNQVLQMWLPHAEVPQVLSVCDYGLMIRENSITNKVASPTKFAEYLSAGLQILTSDNLGDYTEFVQAHRCGIIVNPNRQYHLTRLTAQQRIASTELVEKYFTKISQVEKYKVLLQKLNKE